MKWVNGALVAMVAAAGGAASTHWKLIDRMAVFSATAVTPTRASAQQALSVEVSPTTEVPVTTDISAIGTLQSDESVQLAPEVSGRVAVIQMKEGQAVRAGDPLLSFDNTLAKASEEEAKVRLDLATVNYARTERLAKTGVGTTQDLDMARAERNTANALLNSQRVQLSKLNVVAPFDGVVGFRNVSVGSYVGVGSTLVNLEKIDVLKVAFKIPEANLQKVAIGQTIEISVDAIPDKMFEATVYAIDPMLDVNGRSLSILARLINPDLVLRPGLFARIMLKGQDERQAVTVPEAAIVARGQDHFVWTVTDGKVSETKVTVSRRMLGAAQVDGLSPGSVVVTAGQARLRNGASVNVVFSEQTQAGS